VETKDWLTIFIAAAVPIVGFGAWLLHLGIRIGRQTEQFTGIRTSQRRHAKALRRHASSTRKLELRLLAVETFQVRRGLREAVQHGHVRLKGEDHQPTGEHEHESDRGSH
jgi:hypothetical protein